MFKDIDAVCKFRRSTAVSESIKFGSISMQLFFIKEKASSKRKTPPLEIIIF